MSRISNALTASLLVGFGLMMSANVRAGQEGEGSSWRAGRGCSDTAYSISSFKGNYASVGTYGANVARLLGVGHPDGEGNTHGDSIINVPGPNGTRTVVSITYEGTYTISSDGFGVVRYTVLLPNGKTTAVILDFLATKAQCVDGQKLITEFATMQREPSSVVSGEFVTHYGTRRPD